MSKPLLHALDKVLLEGFTYRKKATLKDAGLLTVSPLTAVPHSAREDCWFIVGC